MAEFKAITTQEEFDAAIQGRLDRERSKYADYESLKTAKKELDELKAKDYEGQIASLTKNLEDANGKLAGLAELTRRAESAENALLKQKVSREYNIPYELSERLNGKNEDELRKDAESLAKYVAAKAPAPLASGDTAGTGSRDAAFKSLLSGLTI